MAPDLARTQRLDLGWELLRVAPGSVNLPSALDGASADWSPALVPGTVASTRRAQGTLVPGQEDFDGCDYWYRLRQPIAQEWQGAPQLYLNLDGLATLVDVYWNDDCVLKSENMFLAHEIDLSPLPRDGVLYLHCKSLSQALSQRRPRPRWRTRLVEQQQLRWMRTTLLGRMPGWSPPGAPVGPYRAVTLQAPAPLDVRRRQIQARLVDGKGLVEARLQLASGDALLSAQMGTEGHWAELALQATEQGWCLQGSLTVEQPETWWPHTHGQPRRYALSLRLQSATGERLIALGDVGFRSLTLDQSDGAFALSVNGVPVFCRGACWMPVDPVALDSSAATLRPTLELARNAGMNMLRVVGTMVYESEDFYALCDELGILVWQDFMFANMDYPVENELFAASINDEALHFLQRVQPHPCLAVLCGGSEVEQQAAMLGLARELWSNRFVAQTLPVLCAELCPQAVFVSNSPSGGQMPFQVDHGVSHYYGVGAYLRPLEDARRADVRFTSECLGFSNVPDESTVDELLKSGGQAVHHPLWKQRVPRDNGAGWDFEDVRDHYMRLLFGVDPMRLRYADMPRYLSLARITSGEVMAQTLAEWRRAGSRCQGALIWFLRDLWTGAGWGLIDALGRPKAAYWYVRRAMQPLHLAITDEGLNGLALHLRQEGGGALTGELELSLYRHEVRVAQASRTLQLDANSAVEIRADGLFDHFVDTAYAYRFGPPGHHLAVATFRAADAARTTRQAFFCTQGLDPAASADLGLQALLARDAAGDWTLTLSARRFAHAVCIDTPGFEPEDNYVSVAPGGSAVVRLRARGDAPKLTGTVFALNAELPVRITAAPAAPA